jgi:putative transposase
MLDRMIEWRGKLASIRCNNGREKISGEIFNWAETQGIRINHLQPLKPQQNAYIERNNPTVRYARLAQFIFASLAEVRDFATDRLWAYKNERQNMALAGLTPRIRAAMAA